MQRRRPVSAVRQTPAVVSARAGVGPATELRGIAWSHPRGLSPLRATATAFSFAHPDVRITWDDRTIEQFAYAPIDELAETYDLLVIDHPHVGEVGMADLLVPLDECLSEAFLADQATNSTGGSHASYAWNGHQWALAIDGAAQFAAYRGDLLQRVGKAIPTTWQEVLLLTNAANSGARVAIPLNGIDAACSLMSIGVNLIGPSFWSLGYGYDPAALIEALEILVHLAKGIDRRSFNISPSQLLDIMGTEDSVAFVPLVFGYSNYARPGFLPSLVSFRDVPGFTGIPAGSVLGGTGIAVSRRSSSIAAACNYAAFVASPDVQRGLYFTSGGQPGHRAAWLDPAVNGASNDFFARTLRTMELSFLRPRLAEEPGFLGHQARVGETLVRTLQRGDSSSEIATELDAVRWVLAEGEIGRAASRP